jgi:hypothetical protein
MPGPANAPRARCACGRAARGRILAPGVGAAASLLLLAWAADADAGVSFSAGLMSARASSDALAGDARQSGYELSLGYRAWEQLSFDLTVSVLGDTVPTKETTEIFYPPDRAEVSVLGLGMRVDVLSPARHRWTPWIGAGFGIATLVWDTYLYEQQGVGPYIALGLDLEPLRGLILRGRAWRLRASTDSQYGETPGVAVTAFSLGVAFEFGRPRRPRAQDAPPTSVAAPPPSGPQAPAAGPEAPVEPSPAPVDASPGS